MTARLPPHYGHGVSGDRFWPRPVLCRQVLTALRQGESVALFGPRRTGKSSLLRECARVLRQEPDFTVVEVNGEGMDAVATLFKQFVAALPPHSREGFLTRVKAIKVPEPLLAIVERWLSGESGPGGDEVLLVTRHWAGLARVIAQLIPAMQARPVLFIDELAYLCEDLHGHTRNPDEVKRLLAMLREWRGAGLGMAIAGSVGIRQFLRRIQVSRNHLTGFTPVHVGPLDPADAGQMLAALAADQQLHWWNEALTRAVIDQSADLLPACLQFAFKYVAAAAGDSTPPGAAEVASIFRDQIRPNFDHEFYHQFDERFADYTTAEQAVAREVFRSLSRSTRNPRSRAFAELADAVEGALGPTPADAADPVDLADLILALEDDGFLTDDRDRDRIAFASRLVGAWWQTRDHRRGRRR